MSIASKTCFSLSAAFVLVTNAVVHSASALMAPTPPLIITEIMYHPAAENGAGNAADAFEFVELKNIGSALVNLKGFTLSGGIDFVFPDLALAPGQLAVVVRDLAAFRSRYGDAPRVAGAYTGQLNNDGERLILEGALNELMLDFEYRDSWFPITDGSGFSIVAVKEDQLLLWSDKTSWRPSALPGGSPGQNESPLTESPLPVFINEALTHTDPPLVDGIELYNPNRTPVDISGWFVTDDFATPKKFRIPAGTIILAAGFRAFSQNDFDAGGGSSFSLSSLGDEVYLFSADAAGNLSGFFHGFDFGASENGVSFGRYVTSVGEEHFVAQNGLSFNAPNSGPRPGLVVINEIMYNPRPTEMNDEFIELENITGVTVPLFDPNAATNTWRVAGGIDFLFPQNFSLPPNGRVLVVSFDPAADLGTLAAFRTRLSVDATTPVVGPFQGKLDNAGERIRLLKPDPPQGPTSPNPGLVPYVLVDEVAYSAASPWPAEANGTGNSLQRRTGSAYGNDPINWQAAPVTAGRANVSGDNGDDDRDGLPNDWEVVHGLSPNDAGGDQGALGDPDQDLLANLQEYRAGTDPGDAASVLRLSFVLPTVEGVKLGFTAMAGRRYSILYGDDLSTGNWRTLEEVSAGSVDRVVEIVDRPSVSARFYRLVTPVIP
ncbi:MAG: lamin tail domain-containing protein [Verrucomicrobiales bacterium]|nr:lamin tail domain-containing protein [Verrucomicrobiales bacterium]